jgi:hypothetical protein
VPNRQLEKTQKDAAPRRQTIICEGAVSTISSVRFASLWLAKPERRVKVEGYFSYSWDSRRYDLKKQQVGLNMRDFKITIARADGQSRRPILRHEIVKANSIAHAETKSGDLIRNDEQLLGICLATRRGGSLPKRYAALCFDCEKTGLYTSIETLERFGATHAPVTTLCSPLRSPTRRCTK